MGPGAKIFSSQMFSSQDYTMYQNVKGKYTLSWYNDEHQLVPFPWNKSYFHVWK